MRIFKGRLRYLTLFFAGGIADLALAPFFIFPALMLSFPVFFIILSRAESKWQAFKAGWCFGFGFFVFGLYWIANSLLVDMSFAWLIPFAACGIPMVLAIYIALMSVLYYILNKRLGLLNAFTKVSLFAILWIGAEAARAVLLTGFPWNLIGYTSLVSLYFAQVAAIGGVYFAGFVVIIIAMLPIYFRCHKTCIAVAACFAGMIGFGIFHYSETQHVEKTSKVLIYQPNVAQTMKWDPLESKRQFIESIDYMRKVNYHDKDLVVWPETGVPYYLDSQPWITELLAQTAPDNGLMITGALRSNGQDGKDFKVWNTLYAISQKGIYNYYDKRHLVPFGEYVPLRDLLPVEKITKVDGEFSRGAYKPPIKFKDTPSFISLICYEIIFPQYAKADKADLIMNITNDGWFGNSTGPYQHLAMTQMRAIEQGVPALRSANTGVSAIISNRGEILKSIPYGKMGHIEGSVELSSARTIYSRYGNTALAILLLVNVAIILIFRKKAKTSCTV